MQIGEEGDFALNYIRLKARQLIGKHGFTWSDYEDLQQEMLRDLVHRLPKHDPAGSPWRAFVAMVVNNEVASIVARRMSPSQEHFRTGISLNEPLGEDGRPSEVGDTLHDLAAGDGLARNIDLEHALARLTEELRSLWDLRVQGVSFTEISQRTGITRPALYDRWAKIVQHLKDFGMEDYFRED